MAGGALARDRLDHLVASYAQAGERKRRSQMRRRLVTTLGIVGALSGAAFVHVMEPSLAARAVAWLNGDGAAVHDVPDYSHDSARFATELAALESRIALASAQTKDLEAERAALKRDRETLLTLLETLDANGSDSVGDGRARGAQLDREIAALAAQRQALEQRWTQFEAQGELLALEIVAVNAQRKELESQRAQITQQQRELAKLIRQAGELYKRNAKTVTVDAAAQTTAANRFDGGFISTPNSLTVDVGELDEMRGGFSVGDGLDVSFGITQIGSVNGVEQYQNKFSVENLAGGVGSFDPTATGAVLLQNGSGNTVSPGVLEAMSNSFGQIVQNTLDDQTISTTTIYDISLQNVPGAVQGSFGQQALDDSLSALR